jgi:hypothetical protein
MSKKIFSFDAETNGLWGKAFAIAAVVTEDGIETARFIGRCPIEGEVNEWVKENVLSQMTGITETHETYEALLADFVEFYKANKEASDIIVHMGLPVEARLFLDAHRSGVLGDWDAPYPLIDIAALPEIGTSVDSYNKEHNVSISAEEFAGGTHNPLYDSIAAERAYRHWLGNR